MRKRNKFRAIKTLFKGDPYDSKKEAGRARELDLLLYAGQIKNLQRQVTFPLLDTLHYGKNTHRKKSYIADFVYEEGSKTIIEDVKSEPTRKLKDYRLRIHLFLTRYILGHEDQIEFREVL